MSHALLSPSASDRWLICAAAPHREQKLKDKGSDAAAWGTAAHAMAEHCLKEEVRAEHAPKHPLWDDHDGDEMRSCVQDYIDFVHEKKNGRGHLFVEQALQIFPQFEVWGTADTVIVGHEPGLMDIIDLKGGTGVVVEAEDNSQLRMYGWGGYKSFEWLSETEIDRVRVSIAQPRRNHYVTKIYSVEELKAWAKEIEPKVAAAFSGAGAAAPGEHCRWCRARATCEERREFIQSSAAFAFADGCEPEKPCVEAMDEAKIVRIFKAIPMIQQYLKDVETWVADQAHERGHALAGLKWVAGRTTRYISNTVAAATTLRAAGIEPFEEPKLLGITAIEKMLKAKGLKTNDVLGECISTKTSDPVLVGEEDPRAPYDPNAGAKQAFSS